MGNRVSYSKPLWMQLAMPESTISALAGAYVGAQRSRRSMSGWSTRTGDADSDTLDDLPTLRDRSSDLLRNAPLALGAINTKVTNVVGTGLKLKSRIDRDVLGLSEEDADRLEANIEREWRLWSESPECDSERTLIFTELQELAFRSTLERGDIFGLLPFIERPGSPYGLKVQLLEADRCSNPDRQPDNNEIMGGIKKENGAPVTYYFSRFHPGNIKAFRLQKWDAVPAFGERTGRRNVIHLFHKRRPGQTRGVPDLAPVVESLKQLDRYTEAEIMAAVVSSMFTVFVKTDTGDGLGPMMPATETGGAKTDEDYKLASGAILDLMPNESIETANPGRPNQAFDPFVQSILRQIGVALELPFEMLIKHFTSSYSASRAAMLEAWKFFSTRRSWLAKKFCQPIYEAWLTEAVALGRVKAPGFLDGDPAIRQAYCGCDWIGPGRGQIDPMKENQADALAEDRGWKTADENTAEKTGGDWEAKHRQRAKEMRMRREDGLEPPESVALIPGDDADADADT